MIGAPQRDREERSINVIKQDTASVIGIEFCMTAERLRGEHMKYKLTTFPERLQAL